MYDRVHNVPPKTENTGITSRPTVLIILCPLNGWLITISPEQSKQYKAKRIAISRLQHPAQLDELGHANDPE